MIDQSLYHDDIKDKMQKYGLPKLKKYPMPDKKHVLSAIKFFNYVEPHNEKELAKNILKRIKEYGMSFDDFGVGEDNRFSKYLPKKDHLEHHGIKGQKWGVRRYQNPDGTLTEAGKDHYGKALSKGIKKADRIGNNNASLTIQETHKALNKNKVIKEFEKTNKTGNSLKNTRKELDQLDKRINLQVNKELEEKYGNSFLNLSSDDQIKYFKDGMKMFEERASKEGFKELKDKYEKLSIEYEKETISFLGDLLGKYGDEPLNSNWAIKYNYLTKEISKQNVKDLAAIEMLRRAGGKI